MNKLFVLIALFTLLPVAARAQDESWAVGQYKIETSYDSSGYRRLTIVKDGKDVYSQSTGQLWFITVGHGKQAGMSREPKVTDITGDGVPDLIVEEFPLRLECCWSYSVFSLGHTFKKEAAVGGFRSEMTFADVNGDGIYEMVGDDPTFYSWYASPRVVLSYDKAQATYKFATNLMKRAAPTAAELAEKQKEFSKATVYAGFPVAPQVYGYMLDLIYSGNSMSAWTFLDLNLTKPHSSKKEFIAEIMQQLEKSPYWSELQRMNHFGS